MTWIEVTPGGARSLSKFCAFLLVVDLLVKWSRGQAPPAPVLSLS